MPQPDSSTPEAVKGGGLLRVLGLQGSDVVEACVCNFGASNMDFSVFSSSCCAPAPFVCAFAVSSALKMVKHYGLSIGPSVCKVAQREAARKAGQSEQRYEYDDHTGNENHGTIKAICAFIR